MQTFKTLMVLILVLASSGVVRATPSVPAQETLVTQEQIDSALERALDRDEALREKIRSTLQDEKVLQLAAAIGMDSITLEKASAAVDALEGSELERVASQTASLEDSLAGGATITISLVALLLIIIIVILLV